MNGCLLRTCGKADQQYARGRRGQDPHETLNWAGRRPPPTLTRRPVSSLITELEHRPGGREVLREKGAQGWDESTPSI